MADECNHLNFYILGAHKVNHGFCPDCNKSLNVFEALNGFMREMRKLIAKAKE